MPSIMPPPATTKSISTSRAKPKSHSSPIAFACLSATCAKPSASRENKDPVRQRLLQALGLALPRLPSFLAGIRSNGRGRLLPLSRCADRHPVLRNGSLLAHRLLSRLGVRDRLSLRDLVAAANRLNAHDENTSMVLSAPPGKVFTAKY